MPKCSVALTAPDVVPQICAGASDEVLISGGYDQAVKVGSCLLMPERNTNIVTCELALQLSHYIGLPGPSQPAKGLSVSMAKPGCQL